MAKFSYMELVMIAIIHDEEEVAKHKLKERKWVHEAWKKEKMKKSLLLYTEFIDDETKFFKIRCLRLLSLYLGCNKLCRTR